MAKKPNSVKRSWVPERKAFERENGNDDFYNSWPWRKLRKRFINANPLCVHCKQKEIVKPAKIADHIVPINKGGAKLDEANLQALCESCHNSKSAKEK